MVYGADEGDASEGIAAAKERARAVGTSRSQCQMVFPAPPMNGDRRSRSRRRRRARPAFRRAARAPAESMNREDASLAGPAAADYYTTRSPRPSCRSAGKTCGVPRTRLPPRRPTDCPYGPHRGLLPSTPTRRPLGHNLAARMRHYLRRGFASARRAASSRRNVAASLCECALRRYRADTHRAGSISVRYYLRADNYLEWRAPYKATSNCCCDQFPRP